MPDLDPHTVTFDDGYAPATRRSYAANWGQFVGWCGTNGQQALPASPATVAAYVEAKGETLRPATVNQHISAIATVHRDRELANPCGGRLVRVACKRIARKKGTRQRQALGITFEMRAKMLKAAIGRKCPQKIGKRDRALLAAAYDSLCRRSELVAIQVEDITRAKDGSATVLIRRSKTDQDGKGQIRYLAPDTVRMIDDWLDASGVEDGLLFRSVDRYGNIGGGLDGGDVGRVWKLLAEAGAADERVHGISGHSTRVGMAQDMAAAGIDLVSIMQAGGWKTPGMVARYIERLNAKNWAAAKLAMMRNRNK